MNELTFEIASTPDRDELVAEIWLDQEMIAELNLESGHLSIELYPRQDGRPWSLDAAGFFSVVEKARASLLGGASAKDESHAA